MNNNNNNINQNEYLFWLIYKNKYIRNQIFNQLNIYKSVSKFCRSIFNGFNQDSLVYFKFKEYILEMKYSTTASTKQRKFFNESYYQDRIVDESLPIQPGTIPTSVKELHINSNQIIIQNSIPSSVETLVILSTFKRDLPSDNVLPSSIHSMIFKASKFVNQKIVKGSLPTQLKKLILNTTATTSIEQQSIPDSLEYLQFCGPFQQDLNSGIFSPLSSSLVYLEFDPEYNISINSPGILPSTLKTLKWGRALILPNVIPNGVEYIELGSNWNQKIVYNTFPPSLKAIEFGSKFNTFIDDNILPKDLEYIEFGTSFDQPINLSYLESLKSLILGWTYNRELTDKSIPQSIEYIEFGKAQNRTIKPNILPSKSLVKIYFSSAALYTGSTEYDKGPLVEGSIPSSVKCVQFENGYHQFTSLPLHFIPSSVEYLDMGFNFNTILRIEHFSRDLSTASISTSQLKVLVLGDNFDLKFSNQFYIPPNLVSLKIGGGYNQLFDKESVQSLPKSLLKLELGSNFNKPLDNLSLTNIKFLVIKNKKYSYISSIPSNIYISNNGKFNLSSSTSSSSSSQDQISLSVINQYESFETLQPQISLTYPKYFEINTKINHY